MTAVSRSFRLLTIAVLGSAAASCRVTPPQEINRKYLPLIEARWEQYQVKPGDRLTLRVYEHEGKLAEQQFLVLHDGRSDPFFMDGYRFGGKTIPEIEADARELLIESQEVKPVQDLPIELSVLVEPAGEVIYFYGQLERPVTVIDLRLRMTLQQAIAQVGGIRLTADSDYALLRRSYGHPPGSPEMFRIDLNDDSEGIILLPDDNIYVQRNFLATVVAYLREFIFGVFPSHLLTSTAVGAAI